MIQQVLALVDEFERPDVPAAIQAGSKIGRFVITGHLGQGGMGKVYSARDTELERAVALKFLNIETTGQPDAANRMIREARTASALNHPNIVTVYDVVRVDSAAGIVMELVDGLPLRHVLADRLPAHAILDIAQQIASALTAAHAAGIVHRDIKPENVILRHDGQVKVLDFGLARYFALSQRTSHWTTGPGLPAGTWRYMSPEQCKAQTLTGASDVFSLGLVVYELSTGRYPFQADSPFETLQAIAQKEPDPPSRWNTELSTGLDSLILRMLAKEPAQRPAAADVVEQLAGLKQMVQEGPSTPAHSPSLPPAVFRRWKFSAVAAIAALLLVSLGWRAVVSNAPPRSMRISPLTGNAGAEVNPALSPDGARLAYAWKQELGDFDLYVKPLAAGDPVRLTTNSGHDISPSWSPDGQRIAFLRSTPAQTEVMVLPSTGGAEQAVLTLRGGLDRWMAYGPQNFGKSGPVWSKDGKRLIVANTWNDKGYGLGTVDFNGAYTLLTEPSGEDIDFCPSVSPNGKSVAFARGMPGAADVYVVPSSGGAPRQITHDHADIGGISWWNDETVVFSSNRGGNTGLSYVRTSEPTPAIIPFAISSGGEAPAASARHKVIAFVTSTDQQGIWRRSLAATASPARPERFIFSSRTNDSPRYSPDGTRIAFISNRSGAWEIWMCRSDGSHPTRLTNFQGATVGSPKWSPDGRSLVFDLRFDRNTEIWTLDVTTGGPPRKFTQEHYEELVPSWSRDGHWIYFLSDRKGGSTLWKRNIAGGKAVLVSNSTAVDATESADGTLYYQNKATGSIWRMPKQGGAAAAVPELADFRPDRNWEVTPDSIYFASHTPEGLPTLNVLRFGQPSVISLGHMDGDIAEGTPSLTVSPDKRWLVYAQRGPRRSNIQVVREAQLE